MTPSLDEHPDPKGPTRGEAAPISVREVESDEHVTYLETADAVRYVAGWTATKGDPSNREPRYSSMPFEEWARMQSKHGAAKAAVDQATEALDTKKIGWGSGHGIEDPGMMLSIELQLDRDGTVMSEPAVPFEDLLAVTPRSVDITYVLEEKTYEMTVPMYVLFGVRRGAEDVQVDWEE